MVFGYTVFLLSSFAVVQLEFGGELYCIAGSDFEGKGEGGDFDTVGWGIPAACGRDIDVAIEEFACADEGER